MKPALLMWISVSIIELDMILYVKTQSLIPKKLFILI